METHVCQWALLCHAVAVQLLLHFAVAVMQVFPSRGILHYLVGFYG